MKLTALKSLEVKAIEIPSQIVVPPFADPNKLSDRIFGALCRINPELPCMENEKFLKNIFKCYFAAGGWNGKEYTGSRVQFMKESKDVATWRKWYAEEKERKATFNKLHAKERKSKNEERKQKYGFAVVDGHVEPIQSWVLEPEGIYFGRGDCPYNGFWKRGATAEDVVVNTNCDTLPELLKTVDDNTVSQQFDWKVDWRPDSHHLADYPIIIGIPNPDGTIEETYYQTRKKIMFSAQSSIKQEGQQKKYLAGASLGKAYENIMTVVKKDFTKQPVEKLGTVVAIYLLFEKGIRIGNKEPTANGTKGLLALEWGKDVKKIKGGLKFDFYGKDSVHDESILITPYIDNIEEHWSKFGKLSTDKNLIKEYIKNVVPEVADSFSPKLARTAVAAFTMTNALKESVEKFRVTKESPIALKKLAFEEANMAVAKRLNHQRGVNPIAEARRKEKFAETKNKLQERESKTLELIAVRKQKIKELKEKKAPKEKIEKLKSMNEKAEERLQVAKLNLTQKESNAAFTGSTSKSAYIDPVIVKEWCEEYDMPIEKIYSKSQLKNFSYTM